MSATVSSSNRADARGPAIGPAPRSLRRRATSPRPTPEWPLYASAATLTAVFTTLALKLWQATWNIPFSYAGDTIAVQAHAKTVLETGWYEFQPLLGAPEGQHYHDFPTADNLHQAAFRLIGWFFDNSATVMNVYYVVGFPLAALSAVWFMRLVGISRSLSVVLAVLFALSPYHFERQEAHLFLASYYPVPLALGVVLLVLRDQPLWRRSTRIKGRLGLLSGWGAFTVLAMALVATASSYYAIFVALLLGAAGLLSSVAGRNWRGMARAAGAASILVMVMLANMAPDMLYARSRPTNWLAVTRSPGEAEMYALKLVQLILPSDLHRFELLAVIRARYNQDFPLPSESPTLGLTAAVGLVLLISVLLASVVRIARTAKDVNLQTNGRFDSDRRGRDLQYISVLCVVAFMVATVGGISSFIALFVTDSLRGWSRMTIVIACFALAAVGLGLDALIEHVRRAARWRASRQRAAFAVSVGLLCFGLADQTSPIYVPDYAGIRASYLDDQRYVEALEAQLPGDAMVFQLPNMPFPETVTNGVLDTDQLKMFLHSDSIRWSGGGLRGRPQADWAQVVAASPVPLMIGQLAVAGFDAIHVDRHAYQDTGAQLSRELTERLGEPRVVSDGGRYSMWSLLGVLASVERTHSREDLAAVEQAVLSPVMPYLLPDFAPPRPVAGRTVYPAIVPAPAILLDNPRDEAVTVEVAFDLESKRDPRRRRPRRWSAPGSNDEAATTMTQPVAEVTMPGQPPRRLDIGASASVATAVTVPPGRSRITISRLDSTEGTDAGAGDFWFDVIDLRVTDPVLRDFHP